ncbi:efflux RND transporter periplasmic adaptor subunit [Sphingomonas oryzagri]|uniref:Efflux RND transporter periplasmic adaptor subunit n=1 Tax=Sphingomonas oryzagri TaxID=3042314 RepID=A0ABT6N6B4_9SPHN|nr:efflux RND transporter periplasmic adaptor subunit [Sphingomonas oryzagri]MDH7640636.1 efflux RND transporter periplasmic adaptor subunit [Sphingomonas oryzagri]
MTRTVATIATFALLAACSKGNQAPPGPPTPHVSVAQPLVRDVVDWDEYVGKFEAPQSVNMSARVTGVVTQILFRNGQDVRAGQPLFVIDPRPFRASLEQAEAQVASARATLTNARSVAARSAELVKVQAVSKEELENNQAQVRTAQASLQAAIAAADNARLNLSFTTVRAPVSGRVSDKRVSLGDQVIANQTLLTTVVSLDPIWFSFDGAESFYLKYLREAQQGQRGSSRSAANPVQIQLSDETGYNWHGRMEFVDNALDPNTGTIRAHAVVANPKHFLTPGMFGRARLLGSGHYQAMLVPDEVITADQSRKLVFVVGRDGKVVQRTVETGPEVQGLRAIRDGLAPTDLVVLDGIAALQPGMAVDAKRTVIKPRAPDTSPSTPAVTVPQASTATTAG